MYLFIAALLISGLTAFPIEWELKTANELIRSLNLDNELSRWLEKVYAGIRETNDRHPYVAYGTDWLAFAHVVIAIAFVGPLKDPVRNIWVIEFGMIACLAVVPHAFIAGQVRQIPLFWRVFDCMFGLFGLIVLYRCHRKIRILQNMQAKS
ncbi:MAG TPA: hypothetical protein VEB86_00245 [Chryseosolibacter sp.]|nr:hypothetical protein [Chryseosolibacter sp.]